MSDEPREAKRGDPDAPSEFLIEAFNALREPESDVPEAGKGFALMAVEIEDKLHWAITARLVEKGKETWLPLFFHLLPGTKVKVSGSEHHVVSPEDFVRERAPLTEEQKAEMRKPVEIFRVVRKDREGDEVETWLKEVPDDPRLIGLLLADIVRIYSQAFAETGMHSERHARRAIVETLESELRHPTTGIQLNKPGKEH